MSAFSAVDAADDPDRLIRYLDEHGHGAMKHYIAAAHARRAARQPVLDLGCGAGHDLDQLERLGVRSIGLDPSSLMVAAAARTTTPLLRGRGEQLPFRDHAFAGCWVERVLLHVVEPAAVVAEVVRCVVPGGLVTVFEPDWSSLAVNGEAVPVEWLTRARHPAVGLAVGALLADAGCFVHDRVEERSWWTYPDLVRNTNLHAALDRAVADGGIARPAAEAWLKEQQRRGADGTFTARFTKILWVATTPSS